MEEFSPDEDVEMAPASPPSSPPLSLPSSPTELHVDEYMDIRMGNRKVRAATPAEDFDGDAYGPAAKAPAVPVYIHPNPERNNISEEADRVPAGAQAAVEVWIMLTGTFLTDRRGLGTEFRFQERPRAPRGRSCSRSI